MKHNEATNVVEYQLSKEFVYWDKARAFYYRDFDSPYILIGLLRVIFGEQVQHEMIQTASSMEQHFALVNHEFMLSWTGDWNPLERLGFVTAVFTPGMFQVCVNEIHQNLKEHDGKLVARC